MQEIAYKTTLTEIPATCGTCDMTICQLPINPNNDEFYSWGLQVRHPECPLIKVKKKVK